jgi:membrane-associated protease RseP (regulator of RpoE activity)
MPQVQCPNCGSYKVAREGTQGCAPFILGFGGLVVFLNITLPQSGVYGTIAIPLGIFFIIAGMFMMANQKYRNKCETCGFSWEVNKQPIADNQSLGVSSEASKSSQSRDAEGAGVNSQQRTAAVRLKEAEELFKEGWITEDEYNQKRDEIIHNL